MESGNIFEYAIAPNAFIDAIRFVVFIVGFVVFAAALHRWLEHNRSWQAGSFLALGLFTSVQELTVLGDPFFPWRLSLLVVMNVCALVAMYRDHQPGGGRVRG